MVIVLDSQEPLVVVRGEEARRVLEQAQVAHLVRRASPAAPQDFAEAMRRVEAEVWNAA